MFTLLGYHQQVIAESLYCHITLSVMVTFIVITFISTESGLQFCIAVTQADLRPSGKGKVAVTAFPSNAMAQATSQLAAVSQSGARDQIAGSSNRHVRPCSGYSPPAQLSLDSRGVPAQPLFSGPQGCAPLRGGSETGFEKGLRLGSDSDSRAAGVRYCLSSSEPAVGAGIWEEQTTRHADLTV